MQGSKSCLFWGNSTRINNCVLYNVLVGLLIINSPYVWKNRNNVRALFYILSGVGTWFLSVKWDYLKICEAGTRHWNFCNLSKRRSWVTQLMIYIASKVSKTASINSRAAVIVVRFLLKSIWDSENISCSQSILLNLSEFSFWSQILKIGAIFFKFMIKFCPTKCETVTILVDRRYLKFHLVHI